MEAELKFVREKRNGVAVVGSSIFDAAGRLGVFIAAECGCTGKCDTCMVKVLNGAEYLAKPNAAETEQLSAARRKNGERLACQAQIISSGEISIMTQEAKKEKKSPEEERAEEYKKEFAQLPLEKKIERLVELEAIAFGETFSYVLNAPYTIGGKLVDFLAQYGFKIEADEKKARTPDAAKNGDEAKAKAEPKKTRAKPKPKKTETE
jgi:ferredoxin